MRESFSGFTTGFSLNEIGGTLGQLLMALMQAGAFDASSRQG